MKKSLLCLLLGLFTSIAFAATQAVGNFTLTYSVSNNEATITDCSDSSGPLEIPATLGGYPVTTIGDYAFYDCSNLTSVTIPEGVTTIGYTAFLDCSSLTSVTIPSSVTEIREGAFMGCSNLYTDANGIQYESEAKTLLISIPKSTAGVFEVPNSVRYIGALAFNGCSALTSVTIPSSVTSIGSGAFNGCSNLWEDANGVQYESDAKVVLIKAPDSLAGAFEIPESVRFIEIMAFAFNKALTSIRIPNNVIEINYSAFNGCEGLESLEIPSSVKVVKDKAFAYCTGLKSLTICEGVKEFELDTFRGCTSLTSVTIPATLKMGSGIFSGCSQLTEIVVNEQNQYVSSINGVLYNKDATVLMCVPGATTSFVIPEGVNIIDDDAFNGCTNLISMVIPEGVTSIGNFAFYNCSSLTSVTIPEGVTSIGECAFYKCSGLTSVTFEGAPPLCGDFCFENVPATGYYLSKHADAWEAVIDVDGNWEGLKMEEYTVEVEPTSYTVDVEVLGDGSVTGAGAYEAGETVALTATPAEGYVFCGWSTTPVSMEAMYSFTMPEEALTLTAYFAPAVALNNYIAGQGFVSADDVDAKIQAHIAENNLKTPEEVEAAIEAHIASNGLLTPAQANQQTQDYIVANKLKSEQEVAVAIAQAIEEYVSSNGLLTPAEAEQLVKDYIADNKLMSKDEAKQELLDTDEVFTADEMKALALGAPVIQVKNGKATVSIQVKQASELNGEWEVVEDGEVSVEITPKAGEKAGFYKFVVPDEQ